MHENEIISQALDHTMLLFPQFCEGFHTFEDSGKLWEWEIEYKREASKKLREILSPYVEGDMILVDDEEAMGILEQLFKLSYFFNWRDQEYFRKTFPDYQGGTAEMLGMIIDVLRQLPNGDWQTPLDTLLKWLDEQGCAANLTMLLPTTFLFLWDPQNHYAIKVSVVNQFLQMVGWPRMRHGGRLTLELYEQILERVNAVRGHIATWGPRDNIDVHSFIWQSVHCLAGKGSEYKIKNPEQLLAFKVGKVDQSTDEEENGQESTRIPYPLNLILAGPPGTGKTYRLLTDIQPYFEEDVDELSAEDYYRERCQDLPYWKIIAVTLIVHGAPMSVPELKDSRIIQAGYPISDRAPSFNTNLWNTLGSHTPLACENVNRSEKNRVLPYIFWKGEDSRWQMANDAEEQIPELFELAEELRTYTPRQERVVRHAFVTFHQSYAYEDFVEGIRPVMAEDSGGESGDIGYEVKPGILREMVRRAKADPKRRHALFIDEINRANISNVLGELITLLEPDKRMRYDEQSRQWVGGVRVVLPYSKEEFGMPDNLHLIGTMNTADRSIALLDHALRRRFHFEDVPSNPEVLRSMASQSGMIEIEDEPPIDLAKMLEVMNRRIEFLLDRDHNIGHSYLIGIKTFDDLDAAFRRTIIPLLAEYFHNDWQNIQRIFADLRNEEDQSDFQMKCRDDAIVTHTVLTPRDLFGTEDDSLSARRYYEVAEEFSGASFRKIYGES